VVGYLKEAVTEHREGTYLFEDNAFTRYYVIEHESATGPETSPAETDDLSVLVDDRYVRDLFACLATTWVRDTRFSSSFDEIFNHPSLQLLLRLGPKVFPLALNMVREDPERWTFVLSKLTGAQPLTPDVRREDAAVVWERWARTNGWT
jgi:hypothetical protein